MALTGPGERLADELDGGVHAGPLLRDLLGRGRGQAQPAPGCEVVVAPDDVQGRDGQPLAAEGHVLRDPDRGLRLDVHRVGTQRPPGLREEGGPDRREPLERVVATRGRTVAVGPLVVAGGVDEGPGEPVKLALDEGVVVVGAR